VKSYRFNISGRVQGVYYRKTVCENALKSNFSGYVKNLADGSVEAAVTCEDSRLEEFKDILKKGSVNSRVDRIERVNIDSFYDGSFNIVY